MSLQMRIVVGLILAVVFAVVTGSVLLLGYTLAGAMFVLIGALMIRRPFRHNVGRRRHAGGLSLAFRRESRERGGRRAAA